VLRNMRHEHFRRRADLRDRNAHHGRPCRSFPVRVSRRLRRLRLAFRGREGPPWKLHRLRRPAGIHGHQPGISGGIQTSLAACSARPFRAACGYANHRRDDHGRKAAAMAPRAARPRWPLRAVRACARIRRERVARLPPSRLPRCHRDHHPGARSRILESKLLFRPAARLRAVLERSRCRDAYGHRTRRHPHRATLSAGADRRWHHQGETQ
jgi:hypothetical protein